MSKPASSPAVEGQLRAGRPRFEGRLDGLRERVVARAVHQRVPRVGRYRLGRSLGEGSYGTVYEACDPELGRDVALKIVPVQSELERSRVVREARMLATLNDPHVIHVFEVGLTDDASPAPYVVMELVRGLTLREWLQTRRRPWADVVALVLQAARGLWAAHRAGIVHRDFKPDNAILGDDGRLRVVDFGLARPVTEIETTETDLPLSASLQLTPVGRVHGTPAYMAPEVFAGDPEPASDQYALCVVLYEGLFGRRPFAAANLEELRERVARSEARLPRRLGDVPSRVAAVVRRGLARDPRRRYRDLGAFIAALERAAGPPRRTWMVWAGSLAVAATLVGARATSAGACRHGEAAWLEARTTAALPPAIDERLAQYRQAWLDTEGALCRERQGPLAWAERNCLDRRLKEVAALVEVVGGLDAAPVDASATDLLRPPLACASAEGTEVTEPTDDLAPGVDALERRLAQLVARSATKSLGTEGVVTARAIDADARELGYPPLEAEAAHRYGRELLLAGRFDDAHAVFERAYFTAQTHGLWGRAAWIATALFRVDASHRVQLEDARRWRAHAEAAFARAGIDPTTHYPYLDARAGLAEREGDDDEAIRLLYAALARLQADGRARSQVAGDLTNHLGAALYLAGRYAEAVSMFREAASIYEELGGAGSPRRAAALDNLGLCLVELDRLDEALELHEEALRLRLAHDPRPVDLASSYGNLALVYRAQDRLDEALAAAERATKLFVEVFGEEHPEVAKTYQARGEIHAARGPAGLAAARRDLQQARRMFVGYGPAWASSVARVDTLLADLDAGGHAAR